MGDGCAQAGAPRGRAWEVLAESYFSLTLKVRFLGFHFIVFKLHGFQSFVFNSL